MTRDSGVYIISVAAELAGVHPQTLRTYERRGLITPQRTAGGTRRYSQRDVERVRLIQELTQRDGVNLAGVLRILDLQDQLELAEKRVAEAQATVAKVRHETELAIAKAMQRTGRDLVLYRAGEIEPHPTAARRHRRR